MLNMNKKVHPLFLAFHNIFLYGNIWHYCIAARHYDKERIQSGTPLSVAFEENRLTTPISPRMLRMGERSGELRQMRPSQPPWLTAPICIRRRDHLPIRFPICSAVTTPE